MQSKHTFKQFLKKTNLFLLVLVIFATYSFNLTSLEVFAAQPMINCNGNNVCTVNAGQSYTISWQGYSPATNCTVYNVGSNDSLNPTGWNGLTGSVSANTSNSITYRVICNDDRVYGNNALVLVNSYPAPTVSLTTDNSSVVFNGQTTLRWTSNNVGTGSCSASGGVNGWAGSKSLSGNFNTGAFTNTVTYNISCTNSAGTGSDSVTIQVGGQTQNPTVNLTADDYSIDRDDNTIIRWYSNNATSCSASGGTNNWAGNRSTSGSFNTGGLINTTTYYINCSNSSGSATDSITISVNNQQTQNPTVNLTADNYSVNYNGSTVVRWYSNDATSCYASGGTNGWYGNRSTSGSFNTGSLANTTVFSISCSNSYGSAYDSVTVSTSGQILIQNQQPTVVISADQTNIPYNGTTIIRWYSTNATSCYATDGSAGWAGTKNIGLNNFYTGSLTTNRTYTITCSNSYGSVTDSVSVNVRGQIVTTVNTSRPIPTSLVTITSSVDRNQPIVPTIDNTRPHPGDEINYTVSYQNIGTGAITNLSLRVDLPSEVDYMFSSPNNPTISGNTLVFNLGTLRANGKGMVTVRVRVRDDISNGTNLNFPAALSYTDPSGSPKSVSANVSAQVWNETETVRENDVRLGASIFGSGFLPGNLFGWLLLFIVILVLILLAKYIFAQTFRKETTTITTVK